MSRAWHVAHICLPLALVLLLSVNVTTKCTAFSAMMAVPSLAAPQQLAYNACDLPVLRRAAVYAAVFSDIQIPLFIPASVKSKHLHVI